MDSQIRSVMPTDYSPGHWQAMKEMAKQFHASGALPAHLGNAERVVMVLQAGAELGIPPVQAINTLYIVNGKVAMEGRAMLKQIMRGGIKVKWKESTETKCTVVLEREGEEPFEETYTIEEAQKAGLTKKDNWLKYPKDMLRWRALSRGSRFYCPDVTEGIHLVEELADAGKGAKWSGDGDVIEVESASPLADALIKEITECPDRKTYIADILPKINDAKGLSFGERAAILKKAEQRLTEWAKATTEKKVEKRTEGDRDATKKALNKETSEPEEEDESAETEEPEEEEDAPEETRPERGDDEPITDADVQGMIKKIRAFGKQSQLIEYIHDTVNPLPLNKKQKDEIRKWVSNKIAQINGRVPDAEDLKAIFGY